MFEKKEQLPPQDNRLDYSHYAGITFLSGIIAMYSLMKMGGYRTALMFYPKGGGGLNLFKVNESGKSKRVFAIDYHPFWDNQTHSNTWKLHYHYGNDIKEMKRHRPYQ